MCSRSEAALRCSRPPAVCLYLCSLPSNLVIFLLSGAVAQRPFVSDSVLTTLRKGPKETSWISGQISHFPETHKVLNPING